MKPTLHCDIRIPLFLKTGDDHNLDDPYILRDKKKLSWATIPWELGFKTPRSILVRWRIATFTTLKCFSTFFGMIRRIQRMIQDDTEEVKYFNTKIRTIQTYILKAKKFAGPLFQ